MFSQTLARVRQQTTESIGRSLTVEVTGPVRYFFQATGVGRRTFRRFTQLEARLFMRGDAKVLVRLDRLAGRPLIKKFLEETAEAAFERTAKGSPYEDELRVAWQANASAWWLVNRSCSAASALADSVSGSSKPPLANEPKTPIPKTAAATTPSTEIVSTALALRPRTAPHRSIIGMSPSLC